MVERAGVARLMLVTLLLSAMGSAGCMDERSPGPGAALVEAHPATTSEEAGDEPSTGVLVPSPRIGDVVTYAREGGTSGAEYGWLREGMAPGEDGLWRTIQVIRMRTLEEGKPADDHGDVFTMHGYEAGTLRAVAWYHREQENVSNPVNMVPGVMRDSWQNQSREGFSYMSPREQASCGVRNIFQGMQAPYGHLRDTMCFWRDQDHYGFAVRWEIVEEDVTAGRFTANAVQTWPGETRRPETVLAQHTYAVGNPYPVRIEHDGTIWLQTSLVRGTTPISQAAPPQKAPGLEIAPAEVWGPSEAGIDHPLPLSSAWQEAQFGYEPLVAFMAAHPDAYVGAARAQVMSGPQEALFLRWILYVVDGEDGIGFWAESRVLADGARSPYAFRADDDPNPMDLWYAPATQRAAELPTVASMWRLAEWVAAGRMPAEPNVWAFDLGCEAEGDCDRRGNRLSAGYAHDGGGTPVPHLLGGLQRSAHRVSLDIDAHLAPSSFVEENLDQGYL